MRVAPGTIQVWSDLGCPWSHVVVWRLWDARRRLGLEDRVRLDHHPFPLELFNSEPTPRWHIDLEAPVAETIAPRAGWQRWAAPESTWPVTMLPPMEAVAAAKAQSLEASEALDRGLRRALWAESRCISLRHVILEVAQEVESIDVGTLAEALDDGRARSVLMADWMVARGDEVRGSAHLFAPDGTNAQNPGITIGWSEADGYRIEADDPSAIDDFVRRAAG
ncbi:MAG TPA: DsbA family protein [Candidatus Angelobacter sp.]|nr:DsbA family protein [Candidatus Angelobacter sp.]